MLAQLWLELGGDSKRALKWARSADDIEWQAAVGDCHAMATTYGKDQPRAVANGCARAGDLKTALEVFEEAPAVARPEILRDMVKRIPAAAIEGLHGELLYRRVRRWSRSSKVQGRLDNEAVVKFAQSPSKKRAMSLLRISLERIEGRSLGSADHHHMRSLASTLAKTYTLLKGRSLPLADRLDRVARVASDAPVANALSAMWTTFADRTRALWWLQHGLKLLPRHLQAHERAALGCSMAANALELKHPEAFGSAISISEAAARELAPAVAVASWECIGAALLRRGDVHAADSIASKFKTPRLRQRLVLALIEHRGFESGLKAARKHAGEIHGELFATLYRLGAQPQRRMAVLEAIARLDNRLRRLQAYTGIARNARSAHRHREAARILMLAMETAKGRGVARQWTGRGVGAAKVALLVEVALTEPGRGIPQLLSVDASPMYLAPEQRFDALTQLARDLRWLSGVDLPALTAALK